MKLAALIPVLNRPQNVGPLVASWEASGAPGTLVFVVERDDEAEIAAIRQTSAMRLMVDPTTTTWPQKINHAVRMINADWYLFGADDLRFHPGWWDATLKARRDYRVIGTNDLANPRVVAGEHATHPLVEGRYARNMPLIDGQPGPLHEGYHHWYVDDEFIGTARARGVWTPCLDAHVEHLHPYFEKAHWDAVYELGESRADQDKATFLSRVDMIRSLVEATHSA